MQIHASCAARDGAGLLLLGPPGVGKSDMLLRLLSLGFTLVADDRVDIVAGLASAAAGLAGLLEVRGLGIVRLPYVAGVPLRLAIALGTGAERLPAPARHAGLGLPLVTIDPSRPGAAHVAALALDCALGRVAQHAGAFA